MTETWVRKNRMLIAALAAVVVVGAVLFAVPHLSKPKVIVTFPVPLELDGFQVYPTPRTFDQPGTVFLLDGNRRTHVANVLHPKKAGDEAFPVVTATDKWNGALLAQYLGTTTDQLNLKSDQTITVKLQLSGGERWRIDTQSLKTALKEVWFPSSGDSPIQEKGTPYITTEAITVREINYEVVIDTTQGGKIETPKIDSAIGSVSAQKASVNGYSLKQSFSKPHYVFFAASKVKLLPGYVTTLGFEPEYEPLTWKYEQLTPTQ